MATSPRLSVTRVPEPRSAEDKAPWRIINKDLSDIVSFLQRAIEAGTLIADGSIGADEIEDGSVGEDELSSDAKSLMGDVSGTTGAGGSTVVEAIRGNAVDDPGATEDGKSLAFNDGNGDFDWVDMLRDVLTTRGDLLVRGASAEERLAVGASGTLLRSDGADPTWATISAILDAAIGSTRGSILYRGAGGWSLLIPDTAGKVLTDGGAGADPSWETLAPAGASAPPDDFDLLTNGVDELVFSGGDVIWIT